MVVLGVLLVLHSVGSYYSLYWVYSWFDIVVHIVAGLWIGLVFLWLASVFGQVNSLKEYKAKSFLIAFVSAIFVGIVWELLENFFQVTFTKASGYSLNTAMDIFNDGVGGLLAYLYFVRRRRCSEKAAEVLHPFYNQTGIIKN